MRLFFLLATMCLSVLSARAQITMQGKVVDSITQKGIPYANIGFPSYSIGTSTNEEGEFIFKIPKERAKDTLVLSSIGYATVKILLKSLDAPKNLTVLMKPFTINLNEVVIKSVDAKRLIKDFLRLRDKNYATEPALMQLFCREITKETDTDVYFTQSEGILEMYKSSVKKNKDQVRLIKGRKKKLPSFFVRNGVKYGLPTVVNGPTAAIILDVVKNPEFFLLHSDEFNFFYEGCESINERLAYVLRFSPIDSSRRALYPTDGDFYQGKIYIDTATIAVVRTEFELSRRGLSLTNLKFDDETTPLKVKKRTFVVNYSEFKGKWYFQSTNIENTYLYRDNLITLSNKLECFITQIKTDSVVRFPAKENIDKDESLGENITEFDDSFWEDYNIIKSSVAEKTPQYEPLIADTASVKRLSEEENAPQVRIEPTEKALKETIPLSVASDEVTFFKGSLNEAKSLAAAQKKMVFVDVYADWCGPCKKMAAEAFRNESVAEKMNAFFVNFKVDADKNNQGIVFKYNVSKLPTTLIIDTLDSVIRKNVGYDNISDFESQINEVIKFLPNGSAFLTAQFQFEKKKRDFDFLVYWIKIRKSLGMNNQIVTEAIVKDVPLETVKQIEFQQLLCANTFDLEGKTFDFIIKHRDWALFENKLKTLIAFNFKKAIKAKDKSLFKKILKANAKIITNPLTAAAANDKMTTEFNLKTQ